MSARNLTLPTSAELSAIAPDVCYEITALINARKIYAHAKTQLDNASDAAHHGYWIAITNCGLESFLLHYRNLKEFLSDDAYKDDIRANHYVPGWTTKAPWVSDKVEAARLHKRLAHVSKARNQLVRGWDITDMEMNACDTFEEFVKAVPQSNQKLFAVASDAIAHRRRSSSATLTGNSTASGTTGTLLMPTILTWEN